MAAKRVLTRLLRLRELEEEQSRLALEFAVGQRNQVQRQMETARSLQLQGRAAFVSALAEQDTSLRCGGLLEMELARQRQLQMQPQLDAADSEVARQREAFLEQRIGRQQVETLVRHQKSLADVDAGRRAQQMMDDWYGRRSQREEAARVHLPLKTERPTGAQMEDEHSLASGTVKKTGNF